ncbi:MULTISPECIES: class F sortase [unclassified Blastococcus]
MSPLRHRAAVAAVGGLGVAGAALLAVGLTAGPGTPTGTAPPMPVADEPVRPRPPADGEPPPSSAVHLTVPAVGLDLPVLPLTPHGGVIDPPTLTAAYWIEPYGRPGGDAADTVYLAAHSTDAGRYGFDPLLAGDADGSALDPGDVVRVDGPAGTVEYTVERSARYDRDELPGAADVWAAVPGRLVLITCVEPGDGRAATENLVVFAAASR